MTRFQLSVKRSFDFGVALIGLIILLPLLLIIAALTHVKSPGPTFFHQRRVGGGGREFTIHKFRTVHVGGNELFPSEEAQTWFGRHSRRWGIDEWPQLYNVLRGDMSLLGAHRPLIDSELQNRFGEYAKAALQMRPAIVCAYGLMTHADGDGSQVFTGIPAQIYDQQAVNLVLAYQTNWHLGKDLALVGRSVQTALTMLRQRART